MAGRRKVKEGRRRCSARKEKDLLRLTNQPQETSSIALRLCSSFMQQALDYEEKRKSTLHAMELFFV